MQLRTFKFVIFESCEYNQLNYTQLQHSHTFIAWSQCYIYTECGTGRADRAVEASPTMLQPRSDLTACGLSQVVTITVHDTVHTLLYRECPSTAPLRLNVGWNDVQTEPELLKY